MKKIILTQDKIALVDDKDITKVSNFKWYYLKNKWGGYVTTKVDGKTVYLHRIIMDCPVGKQVDHINHNGLDNRRENLRIVTQTENNGNQKKAKHNTSGYKGVSFYKAVKEKPWSAYITNARKKIHLGYFKTPESVALAYNNAAIKQWGEFANLNIL